MSAWNLGADDVSEETRTFKDKIASKDGQIAAQQDKLARQAADLDELKERLDEALHKLTSETRRALQLECDLQQRSEDLRNEKIASENVKATLTSAVDRNKGSSMEMRDLEATLERISHTSDEHKARGDRLEKEKYMLETRVRELENNLRTVTPPLPTTTPGRRVAASRPRSSSLSNFRITTLEQDLSDLRTQLAKKDAELAGVSQKFAQVQKDLVMADNEKLASERKWCSRMEELQASLEEKEEELVFLREQGSDGSREEELLKRIEEDDAKIAALETMARGASDTKQLKEKVRRLESQLKEERNHQIGIVKEKEAALDALDDARHELTRLSRQLQDRDVRERHLNEKAVESLETCDDPLMDDNSCLIDMDTLEPQSLAYHTVTQPPVVHPSADTISHIERLLVTVDRLRGERDSLRRDVQFLESESRFAIEALEAKLSASISTASNETVASLGQMKYEMDELHAQLDATRQRSQAFLAAKNAEIQRLGLHVRGLAVVVASQSHQVPEPSFEADLKASQAHAQDARDALKDLEERYDVTVLCLEAVTSQRDDLLSQLRDKDRYEKEVDFLRQAEEDARQELDELMHQVSELNAHIDDIESERDSLTLQVTNLMTDLQNVQDELTNAESRYTNLQFHQLSTMTSNEATRTLRDHIEELEHRVMRRTEQIGIHQHDIKRMETNLRLQEERLGEMTAELETLAAQKDAMVEDCADAREARDQALAQVEALEEELEASSENEVLVTSLIAVVADTASRARQAIQRSAEETSRAWQSLSIAHEENASMQSQLEDKTTALGTLTQLSGQYRDELDKAKTMLAERHSEVSSSSALVESLERDKLDLEAQLAILRAQDYESTIRKLEQQKEDLESRLEERDQAEAMNKDAERTLIELRRQHAEAVGALQSRLDNTTKALEELEALHKSAEDDHLIALEDASASMRELEGKLEATRKDLEDLQSHREQCDVLMQEQTENLVTLQEDLKKASTDYQDVLQVRDALQAENSRLLEDLEHIQKEQEATIARSNNESLSKQQELQKKVQTLQGRLEEHIRLLDMSKEEAARLADRLLDETEGRAQDEKDHTHALASAKDDSDRLSAQFAQVQEELASVQTSLVHAEEQLRATEEERTALQQDITSLEADVQKSKSLNRYLETQIKESEHVASLLKGDIECIKADLARSEKVCKAAEVNLSLQNAQHKRETSELQRELAILRSRPNLEQALSELEDRNTEMEELLRAKCAEIEENDDRVLEMLKEKKKQTTKVESLTRKVQNLQAKLAAAKASNPVQQPIHESSVTNLSPSQPQLIPPAAATMPVPPSRQRSVTVASSSPASRPQSSIQTPPTSALRASSQRVVSGPSSLPRPKTPERSRAAMPVFKARTPERHMLPAVDPMPSAVVIGKKRAAPDDFEACENLPAQAFSADGHDVENRTPRVRRVLNSLQSGFTPVRNQNRPTVPMPSPRRTAPPSSGPYISDMTNSPFALPSMPTSSTKPSNKRSWLGKIRGSSQVMDKPSGMR